jgi:probable phosphoglycerate mutase
MAVVEDEAFCERHPGEADGMSYEDAIAKYGYDDWEDDPAVALSPGGETWIEFHDRIFGAMRRVATEHADRTVVIACHAGVIDAAIRGLLDLPMVGGFELFTQNTALSELVFVPARERRSERWRLVRYNDAGHLSDIDKAI